MKPLARELTKHQRQKFRVVDTPGRYMEGVSNNTVPDKTQFCQSRPLSKRTVRNANRALTKSGRQRLNRDLAKQVNQ